MISTERFQNNMWQNIDDIKPKSKKNIKCKLEMKMLDIKSGEYSIETIHAEATAAARAAAEKYFTEKLGGRDQYACGFSWVTVQGVRLNTKIGRAMAAVGFQKSWSRGIYLWNPASMPVQNVDCLYAGAAAYAAVLQGYGFDAYAESRLD
jgi:hypothetical protein